MEVRFIVDISSRLQVVADAAMNIASSVDGRASAYIDALWIQKKAEDQLSKVKPCRLPPFTQQCMHAIMGISSQKSMNLLASFSSQQSVGKVHR